MIENALFIVLADGHYNSLGLVRSLGRAGYTPKILLIGRKDAIVCYSKHAKNLTICRDIDHAIDLIINKYSSTGGHKFIVTGNDKYIAAIDRRYDELKNSFITYNCGGSFKINELMSKAAQNRLAQQVGLNVPPYRVIKVKDSTIPDIPFPVITKAINSIGAHWKDIVYLCHNEKELIEAYKQIPCEEVIVQHYVEKDNETGFNGISILGGEQVYLPLQLTYQSTSDTSFGNSIYLFRPYDEVLVKKIKALIKSTGYSGSFSVDLLIGKDHKIYFLEINFRNSGWSYPYTRAGANLPAIWAESTIHGQLDTSREKIKRLPFTVTDEYMDLYENSKKGFKKTVSTFIRIFKSNSLIYLDFKDTRPFRHIITSKLKSILHL